MRTFRSLMLGSAIVLGGPGIAFAADLAPTPYPGPAPALTPSYNCNEIIDRAEWREARA